MIINAAHKRWESLTDEIRMAASDDPQIRLFVRGFTAGIMMRDELDRILLKYLLTTYEQPHTS